jgi:hypothetical protein
MAEVTKQEQIVREPEWMEAYRKGLIEDVRGVTGTASPIPEYQVAGFSPEQVKALQLAKEGIGSYKPYLDQANQTYGQAGESYMAGAGMGLSGAQMYDPNMVNQYMNPYQQAVTQKAMEEMNRQAAIQRQGVSSQAARSGAFGGSRFGVQQAELGRNLADVQSQRILQDYSQNYSQAQQAAMGAFQNQQQRMQNAGAMAMNAGQGIAGLGQNYANLGQMTSALGQGEASFQYNLGQNVQQQNQRELEAQRMNQQLYNQEPYQRLSYYADILNRTPSGQSTTTQTSAPSPSPFSQIAGVGLAGLGAYNLYNK